MLGWFLGWYHRSHRRCLALDTILCALDTLVLIAAEVTLVFGCDQITVSVQRQAWLLGRMPQRLYAECVPRIWHVVSDPE